jgi:hypothetical protein
MVDPETVALERANARGIRGPEVEPVSMVAMTRGKLYNSEPHGLCSHEATAFVYALAKGICTGECR